MIITKNYRKLILFLIKGDPLRQRPRDGVQQAAAAAAQLVGAARHVEGTGADPAR